MENNLVDLIKIGSKYAKRRRNERKFDLIRTRGITSKEDLEKQIYDSERLELEDLNNKFLNGLEIKERDNEMKLLNKLNNKFVNSLRRDSEDTVLAKLLNELNNKFVRSLKNNIKFSNDKSLLSGNNQDRSNFHKYYEEQTNFKTCKCCGEESGLDKMRKVDDKIQFFIESLNLQDLRNQVLNSYIVESTSPSFIDSFNSQFDKNALLKNSNYICSKCYQSIKTKQKDESEAGDNISDSSRYKCGVIPNNLIGLNGLFKGEVPSVLKDLSFIEISMISIYNPITKVQIEGNFFTFKIDNKNYFI